jgi:hypothetical protein
MLFSSSRINKKNDNSEVVFRKSLRELSNLRACLLEAPRHLKSKSKDFVNTHPRRATGSAKHEIKLKIIYKVDGKDKSPPNPLVRFL